MMQGNKRNHFYVLTLRLLLCFVTVYQFSGCLVEKPQQDYEKAGQRILINLENSGEENLSSVIESIRYVPLETSQKSLIGYPWSIQAEEDYIITFHQGTIHQINVFTKDGKFINRINIKHGDGPGELYYPKYFHAQIDEKIISVIGYRKMNRYSFSGELIHEIMLEFSPQAFTMLNDDKFAFFMGNSLWGSNSRKMNLLITDLSGNILKQYLPIKSNRSGLSMFTPTNFSVYKEKNLLHGYPGYNIYQLSSMDIELRYIMDFGEYSIPEQMYKERSANEIAGNSGFEFIMRVFEEEYASAVANFFEFDSIFTFNFNTSNDKKHTVFYSKENHEYKIAHKWVNDVDFGISPHFYSKAENELIAVVEPIDLIQRAEEIRTSFNEEMLGQYKKNENNLLSLSSKINKNDNPILMFAKIKTSN